MTDKDKRSNKKLHFTSQKEFAAKLTSKKSEDSPYKIASKSHESKFYVKRIKKDQKSLNISKSYVEQTSGSFDDQKAPRNLENYNFTPSDPDHQSGLQNYHYPFSEYCSEAELESDSSYFGVIKNDSKGHKFSPSKMKIQSAQNIKNNNEGQESQKSNTCPNWTQKKINLNSEKKHLPHFNRSTHHSYQKIEPFEQEFETKYKLMCRTENEGLSHNGHYLEIKKRFTNYTCQDFTIKSDTNQRYKPTDNHFAISNEHFSEAYSENNPLDQKSISRISEIQRFTDRKRSENMNFVSQDFSDNFETADEIEQPEKITEELVNSILNLAKKASPNSSDQFIEKEDTLSKRRQSSDEEKQVFELPPSPKKNSSQNITGQVMFRTVTSIYNQTLELYTWFNEQGNLNEMIRTLSRAISVKKGIGVQIMVLRLIEEIFCGLYDDYFAVQNYYHKKFDHQGIANARKSAIDYLSTLIVHPTKNEKHLNPILEALKDEKLVNGDLLEEVYSKKLFFESEIQKAEVEFEQRANQAVSELTETSQHIPSMSQKFYLLNKFYLRQTLIILIKNNRKYKNEISKRRSMDGSPNNPSNFVFEDRSALISQVFRLSTTPKDTLPLYFQFCCELRLSERFRDCLLILKSLERLFSDNNHAMIDLLIEKSRCYFAIYKHKMQTLPTSQNTTRKTSPQSSYLDLQHLTYMRSAIKLDPTHELAHFCFIEMLLFDLQKKETTLDQQDNLEFEVDILNTSAYETSHYNFKLQKDFDFSKKRYSPVLRYLKSLKLTAINLYCLFYIFYLQGNYQLVEILLRKRSKMDPKKDGYKIRDFISIQHDLNNSSSKTSTSSSVTQNSTFSQFKFKDCSLNFYSHPIDKYFNNLHGVVLFHLNDTKGSLNFFKKCGTWEIAMKNAQKIQDEQFQQSDLCIQPPSDQNIDLFVPEPTTDDSVLSAGLDYHFFHQHSY